MIDSNLETGQNDRFEDESPSNVENISFRLSSSLSNKDQLEILDRRRLSAEIDLLFAHISDKKSFKDESFSRYFNSVIDLIRTYPKNGNIADLKIASEFEIEPMDKDSRAATLVMLMLNDKNELSSDMLIRAHYVASMYKHMEWQELVNRIISYSNPWVEVITHQVSDLEFDSGNFFGDWQNALTQSTDQNIHFNLGGRVITTRRHKKSTFIEIQKDNSNIIQLGFLDEKINLADSIKIGDLLRVSGTLILSRSGERTLSVDNLLFHHTPLIVVNYNDFLRKQSDQSQLADLIKLTRSFWQDCGFDEIITPILTKNFEGGRSRPFVTWEASSDNELYMRVTSEIGLIKSISYSMRNSYEIGASFRNESRLDGDSKEFLLFEAYSADMNLEKMLNISCRFILNAISAPASSEFVKVRYTDLFEFHTGVSVSDTKAIYELGANAGLSNIYNITDKEVCLRRVFRKIVEPNLKGFLAVTDIPGPSSPLIKGKDSTARRIWLYVDGTDLAEVAESETNPNKLKEKLEKQFHDEPRSVLRDYRALLQALELGIPGVVGIGLGFSRLALLREKHK